MKYEIVPATIEHVELMHPHIREEDAAEMWLQGCVRPEEGLKYSFETAAECWSVMLEGNPVPCLMFGISKKQCFVDASRCIWLLGTRDSDKVKKSFVVVAGRVLATMAAGHTVYNYVSADHHQSLRWLKWLGFRIMDAKPYGWLNKPFHYVERTYPCASTQSAHH